jgi:hypothetical protein
MLEKTTCDFVKNPLAPAAIAVAGMLPLQVGPAAWRKPGMLSWLHAGTDSGGMFRGLLCKIRYATEYFTYN